MANTMDISSHRIKPINWRCKHRITRACLSSKDIEVTAENIKCRLLLVKGQTIIYIQSKSVFGT
jgi:hypothetical protein